MDISNELRVEWIHRILDLRAEAAEAGLEDTDFSRLAFVADQLWCYVPGARLYLPEQGLSASPDPDPAPLPAAGESEPLQPVAR